MYIILIYHYLHAVKRAQLEAKNAEANEKLKRMAAEQQEAEHWKAASIEIQEALCERDKYVAICRKTVMAELAEAEPAIIDAQAAVKGTQLSEVRTMANPPEAVKLATESVSSSDSASIARRPSNRYYGVRTSSKASSTLTPPDK